MGGREGMKTGGLLLIAQLSQQRCTRLHAISSTTSPSKLRQNPGNLTMSWDRVPKHGAEGGREEGMGGCGEGGEKSEQLGTLSYFFSLSLSSESPASGILSAQSSHRHLNLPPRLHPIPAAALFKSLPPPCPPRF